MYRRLSLTCLALIAFGLAGCQGQVSVDLTTEKPADPAVRQVVAGLAGLQFAKSDGSTEDLEFTASESVNFNGFQNGSLLTLFTDEALPPATYTGVRLLFDTTASGRFVTDGLARRYQLLLAAGDYADFDFVVEKDKSSRREITLTLDLRQSLSLDSTTGVFTLTPVLRSVVTADAGIVAGTVAVTCDAGTSLAQGGAVYLFRGLNVVPDDRGGAGDPPYATGALTFSSVTGQYSYRLLDLPAGDYTLAATCDGTLENPATNDALVFRGAVNVKVVGNAVVTADLSG
ncbi:MAG: DUF4382 domain-containing protein [Steroidobacteraceae bacterium]